MVNPALIDWSRLQFAMTAGYHWLFVPLTLGLAVIMTIVLKILAETGLLITMATSNVGLMITEILVLTMQFNIVFAVFNLIPLPPFDGSKVLYYFLPYKAKQWFDKLEAYSFYILLVLFITEWYVYIINPAYIFVGWLLNLILII
jgi:Zn-dependent protease